MFGRKKKGTPEGSGRPAQGEPRPIRQWEDTKANRKLVRSTARGILALTGGLDPGSVNQVRLFYTDFAAAWRGDCNPPPLAKTIEILGGDFFDQGGKR